MSGNIVDILLVVDADLIASGGQVKDAVYLVGQRQLVDPQAQGDQQDGGNELWIDVKRGDVIRWRTTTLSRNFDKSTVISRVYKGGQQDSNAGDISTPELYTYQDVLVPYVKEGSDPTQAPLIGSTKATVSLWQANAVKAGSAKIWYMIDFYVLDDAGKIISQRLSWDPFLSVSL